MQCSHIYQQLTLTVLNPAGTVINMANTGVARYWTRWPTLRPAAKPKRYFFFLNGENYRLQMEKQKSFLNIHQHRTNQASNSQ